MRKYFFALFIFLLACNACAAQTIYYRDTTVSVIQNGIQLTNAWAGGFNSPVFAEMDVNNDGLNDLLTWESQSQRMDIFINMGGQGSYYKYAPGYRSVFPLSDMSSWIRTFDYDNDGDLDLFTYMSTPGIRVFRNMTKETGSLSFTLASNFITTHYGNFSSNIYVSAVTMPALVDLDNDGDMDVLAFSNGGNYVECNKNLSIDSGAAPSSFLMYNIPLCWGYFALSSFTNTAQLPPIPGSCPLWPANPFRTENGDITGTPGRKLHSGSSFIAIDMDGDGDKDVINGDILGTNLLYLENCGTPDSAWICSQDTAFPSYNVPSVMHDVGAPYYLDVDNDGNKDLIVANFFTGEDLQNVLLYKNTTNNSSNVFSFISNRFLSDEMIETGTGSHPVFTDINGDGLLDLIIGNDFYYNNNQPAGKLAYYMNTGSLSMPQFTFMTDDFAGLSAYSLQSLYPTFGDLDNDGDNDMLIGTGDGTLLYFINNGNGNYSFSQANYQSIDVGDVATPQIADVNRDGKPDLVIGERSGTLNYFENTGTVSQPVFTAMSQNFGNVDVRKVNSFAGFSVPFLYDDNGSYELLVGSESGYIYQYENIDGNLNGNFTLVDSMYKNLYEPSRCAIARADIDNDNKPDLIIGNYSGGCVLYTQNTLLGLAETVQQPELTVMPVPANDAITIRSDLMLGERSYLLIYDISGRIVTTSPFRKETYIPISNWSAGVYFCKVVNGEQQYPAKLFIKY